MSVRKLFREDPYLRQCQAKITSVNEDVITVDQTVAYAFSGGQQSDAGTIGGYEIRDAAKHGKTIVYTIDPNHSLHQWDEVLITIDREKRYKIMKLHFAAEIIYELMNQLHNHPAKIGANVSSEKARVDFIRQDTIASIFPELEQKAKEIIDANLDITSAFSDQETERRYREIRWFGAAECGGTHLRKTGEIGPITLKRNHLGQGKERIEIYLSQ